MIGVSIKKYGLSVKTGNDRHLKLNSFNEGADTNWTQPQLLPKLEAERARLNSAIAVLRDLYLLPRQTTTNFSWPIRLMTNPLMKLVQSRTSARQR